MDIKKFLKTAAKFFVFCIVLFVIIGVIAVLTSPPVSTGISITTGKVTDHNLQTSVEVTLEGKNDSYNLSMIGPDGIEVDSKSIIETQMADEKESVLMGLTEESRREVAGKPGTYLLTVTNSSGNKVCEKSLGPYSGIDLSIKKIDEKNLIYKPLEQWGIDEITLQIKNKGDLPVYVTRIDVETDILVGKSSYTESTEVSREKEVILPGKTTEIRARRFYFYTLFAEDCPAEVRLKEGFEGEGKTIGTLSL